MSEIVTIFAIFQSVLILKQQLPQLIYNVYSFISQRLKNIPHEILQKMVPNNLINRTRKIFSRATNIFWSAHFVFIGAQEILPHKISNWIYNFI